MSKNKNKNISASSVQIATTGSKATSMLSGGQKAIKLFSKKSNLDSPISKSNQGVISLNDSIDGYLEPPIPIDALAAIPGQSELISSSIDIYAQNIAGFGFDIKMKANLTEAEIIKAKSQKEKIEAIMTDPNPLHESATSVFKRVISNREALGNGYIEIVRNLNGEIADYYFAPGTNVRICNPKITSNSSYDDAGFLLLSDNDKVLCYFASFGDVRYRNKKTGDYSISPIPLNDRATELIPFKLASTESQFYGLPRFIAAQKAIVGNIYASTSNNSKFQKNCIPDKIISISNGNLISGEDDVKSFFRNNFQGPDNAGKALLLEVTGTSKGVAGVAGNEKAEVNVIDLNNWKDADFLKFQESNDNKIRRIYKLAPILTGEVSDVNRATAVASKEIAEEQIFSPERIECNEIINQTFIADILKDEEYIYVSFEFKKLKIIDPEQNNAKAKTVYETRSGSYNEIREILGLDPVDEDYSEVANMPLFAIELTQATDAANAANEEIIKATEEKLFTAIENGNHGLAVKILTKNLKGKLG